MPAALTAQAFSDYEFCPRLVQLGQLVEPPSWPVRHAVKRYLLSGVRQLLAGESPDAVCWEVPTAFLDEAGDRGFEHAVPLLAHDRNAYTLMRDYACWLEGALRLVAELGLEVAPADPAYVEGTPVLLDCWTGQWEPKAAHTFRVTDRATAGFSPRWLELLASLDPAVARVLVHTFILPAPAKDRLPSPLCMAYAHPMTGHLRLATHGREKVTFTQSWKRVARWETENTGAMETILWPEWREGIARDECLEKCYRKEAVELALAGDAEFRRELMRDAGQIVAAMGRPGEAVRKRELCPRCYMRGYCHPRDDEERESYRVISSLASDPVSPAAARR